MRSGADPVETRLRCRSARPFPPAGPDSRASILRSRLITPVSGSPLRTSLLAAVVHEFSTTSAVSEGRMTPECKRSAVWRGLAARCAGTNQLTLIDSLSLTSRMKRQPGGYDHLDVRNRLGRVRHCSRGCSICGCHCRCRNTDPTTRRPREPESDKADGVSGTAAYSLRPW